MVTSATKLLCSQCLKVLQIEAFEAFEAPKKGLLTGESLFSYEQAFA